MKLPFGTVEIEGEEISAYVLVEEKDILKLFRQDNNEFLGYINILEIIQQIPPDILQKIYQDFIASNN